jgi:hypothetical protein
MNRLALVLIVLMVLRPVATGNSRVAASELEDELLQSPAQLRTQVLDTRSWLFMMAQDVWQIKHTILAENARYNKSKLIYLQLKDMAWHCKWHEHGEAVREKVTQMLQMHVEGQDIEPTLDATTDLLMLISKKIESEESVVEDVMEGFWEDINDSWEYYWECK